MTWHGAGGYKGRMRYPQTLLAAAAALVVGTMPVAAHFDDGVAALRAGDYDKARAAWQADADGGDARCQYSLGYLFQFGLGVPIDLGKAREWYEKAAAQNNPDALYALGLMYENGKAGRKDLAEAMSDYRKADAAGPQYDADYAIGRMYLRGRGVARNQAEGIKWLKKAAEHDQPAAQYMLGAAYEAGWGVPPNPMEAYFWYRRAADGDQVELQEQDMAFEPKIAIEALKKRLSREEMAAVEARLRRHPPAKAPVAATKPKAQPVSQPVATGERPDALTKQTANEVP